MAAGPYLIAPTEPESLRDIGTTAQVTEEYGADILIPGNGFFVGIQRKEFPGDFLSSLHDGRLHTSLTKLTKCEVRVLVLEGRPAWTTSGFLVSDYAQFSRAQLRNLMLSAHFELGIHSVWTDSLMDTIDLCRDMARWAVKPRHDSLFSRPSNMDPYKRTFSERDKAVFILQGFDGIGPELAGRIYDHFGRVPLAWTASDEQFLAMPGMGKGRLSKLKDVVK